ncbi:hypothetical protein ACGFNU_39165 [Spirillospora sp. NPDC048911]|uniref:hypothetical protein n=1 Tax=Spirillospora sp. NPDC048911 TaxID=3364527 RepID=UPI003710569D
MIELDVLDPRRDPEPPYWRALVADAGRHAVWSYDLLRIAAWTSRHQLRLSVVHDSGRPAAVVCAVLAGMRAVSRRYASPGMARLGVPAVLVPSASAERGWWFVGEPAPEHRRDLLRHATRGWFRPGVLWLRAGERDRPTIPGAVRLTRPLNPVARVATPWRDVDGWYAALSQSRRADLRRQRRGLRDLECLTGPARDLASAAEFAALLWRNENKYRGGLLSGLAPSPPLPFPYIEALIGQPDVQAITYRDGRDRLLGAGLILDHPEWPLYWRWGALPVRHLYFDSYGRLIEWAIAAGKTGVILGKGKSDLKAALGAELVPSYAIAATP